MAVDAVSVRTGVLGAVVHAVGAVGAGPALAAVAGICVESVDTLAVDATVALAVVWIGAAVDAVPAGAADAGAGLCVARAVAQAGLLGDTVGALRAVVGGVTGVTQVAVPAVVAVAREHGGIAIRVRVVAIDAGSVVTAIGFAVVDANTGRVFAVPGVIAGAEAVIVGRFDDGVAARPLQTGVAGAVVDGYAGLGEGIDAATLELFAFGTHALIFPGQVVAQRVAAAGRIQLNTLVDVRARVATVLGHPALGRRVDVDTAIAVPAQDPIGVLVAFVDVVTGPARPGHPARQVAAPLVNIVAVVQGVALAASLRALIDVNAAGRPTGDLHAAVPLTASPVVHGAFELVVLAEVAGPVGITHACARRVAGAVLTADARVAGGLTVATVPTLLTGAAAGPVPVAGTFAGTRLAVARPVSAAGTRRVAEDAAFVAEVGAIAPIAGVTGEPRVAVAGPVVGITGAVPAAGGRELAKDAAAGAVVVGRTAVARRTCPLRVTHAGARRLVAGAVVATRGRWLAECVAVGTVVVVRTLIAMGAIEALGALAGVGLDPVDAVAVVLARVRLRTVGGIDLTQITAVPARAVAGVLGHSIHAAAAILTGVHLGTIVGVDLTVVALVPREAVARVRLDPVDAGAAVLAGVDLGAVVDVVFAQLAVEARVGAVAGEGVHAVDALAAVLAGCSGAVIDVLGTGRPSPALITRALVAVHQVVAVAVEAGRVGAFVDVVAPHVAVAGEPGRAGPAGVAGHVVGALGLGIAGAGIGGALVDVSAVLGLGVSAPVALEALAHESASRGRTLGVVRARVGITEDVDALRAVAIHVVVAHLGAGAGVAGLVVAAAGQLVAVV